ncbi:MAG: DUF4007 family protein [Blastocatellia bacterium]
MSLSFHESFPLECENIAKLLAVVVEKPSVSNVEIAELTGLGSGKNPRKGLVQPTIEYADCAGLITVEPRGRQINLTDVGRVIFEHDRQMKKPVTQWALHYHLSRAGGKAEAWAHFVQEFLPQHQKFERAVFEKSVEEKFGSRAKLRSIKPGLVLNSYTESRGLGLLRMLRESDREYLRGRPYIPTPYVIGYTLAEIWEARHPTRMMIDEDALSEPGHLGPTIGLKDSDSQEQLNDLTHIGIIGQMREAPPFQVVKQWGDKLELLRKAYVEGE